MALAAGDGAAGAPGSMAVEPGVVGLAQAEAREVLRERVARLGGVKQGSIGLNLLLVVALR